MQLRPPGQGPEQQGADDAGGSDVADAGGLCGLPLPVQHLGHDTATAAMDAYEGLGYAVEGIREDVDENADTIIGVTSGILLGVAASLWMY